MSGSTLKECRVCGGARFESAIDLGVQPWRDQFLRQAEAETEKTYPLHAVFCADCRIAQLNFTVPKEIIFEDDTFLSGMTQSLGDHFRQVAAEIDERFFAGAPGKSVLDVGSGDGAQLKYFKALGWDVLGVEFSKNAAQNAAGTGIATVNQFFNRQTVQAIGRKFHVINAAGLFLQLEELHSCIDAIHESLRDDGIFIVQLLYMKRITENRTFDQIYRAYLLDYNLQTIQVILNRQGLEMFDAYLSPVHGGSVIGFVTHRGKREPTQRLADMLQAEEAGLVSYRRFAEAIRQMKAENPVLLYNGVSAAKITSGTPPPDPGQAAPAGSRNAGGTTAAPSTLDVLNRLLRQIQDCPTDKVALGRVFEFRRQLARLAVQTSPDALQALFRGEFGQIHEILCGSSLPGLPVPVEEQPLVTGLEEQLRKGFAPGAFLAAMLYRPASHWPAPESAGLVPGWMLKDYLAGVLAPSVVNANPGDRALVEQLAEKHGLDLAKTIVLFAGARDGQRIYPFFGPALRGLVAERELQVVALGTAGDIAVSQRCLDEIGAKSVNLCGQLTVAQAAALMRGSLLAVGVENVLAHVACAANVRHVIVMGGGCFGRFLPYSALSSIVCVPLTCYGCNWRCCYKRPHCVTDIAPEVVETAIRETLARAAEMPRVFVQHPAFHTPPKEAQWSIPPDMLPAMLMEFILVTPDDVALPAYNGMINHFQAVAPKEAPIFEMPPSICGCPVSCLRIARKAALPAGMRVLGRMPSGGLVITIGRT